MIIVTGATGKLGRAIASQLLDRMPAAQIGASVRDVQKASDLEALGVRVRTGNFDEPETLLHAFEGASQVLIISSNARQYSGDTLKQHRNAIDAARIAGARRIVYTSHMAASASSAFPPMLDHAATEEMLRASGVAWTSLRNGFYASSAVYLIGDAAKTGTIKAPVDGKVAWTAHDDLAAAAAAILADEGRYDGPTPPLTAAEALDLTDLAEIVSQLSRRPVSREVISDEELRAQMAARGLPPHVIDISVGLYIASRNGEFARIDPTLERLLGRRPTGMQDVLGKRVTA